MSEKIPPAAYYEKITRRWAGYFEREPDPVSRFLLTGFDVMAESAGIKPHARILDVGCGEGRFLRLLHNRFPDACLVGFDSGGEMLEIARRRSGPNIQFVLGDAFHLQDLGRFDIVFCSGLTEHFTDEGNVRLFREIGKAVSPSGKAVVRFVNKYSSWHPVACVGYRREPILYRGHTLRKIRTIGRMTRFQIEKVEGDYVFPVFLYWLRRIIPRKLLGLWMRGDRRCWSRHAPWACRHLIVTFAPL